MRLYNFLPPFSLSSKFALVQLAGYADNVLQAINHNHFGSILLLAPFLPYNSRFSKTRSESLKGARLWNKGKREEDSQEVLQYVSKGDWNFQVQLCFACLILWKMLVKHLELVLQKSKQAKIWMDLIIS